MGSADHNAEIADRFAVISRRFCQVVDDAAGVDRSEFVAQIYQILPKLIDEAVNLPEVESSGADYQSSSLQDRHEQWDRLYKSLKENLRDWDVYRQVFDPTKDSEAISGSLADDIADIYDDLKKALLCSRSEDMIWEWRLLFQSHWGKHAIDALLVAHFWLQNDGS
jgi:hypothetical protein